MGRAGGFLAAWGVTTPGEAFHALRGLGGLARAAKLTDERRSEIAKDAATARWAAPRGNSANETKVLVPQKGRNPRSPEQYVLWRSLRAVYLLDQPANDNRRNP